MKTATLDRLHGIALIAQSAEPQPCSAQSLWCAAKAIRRR